MTVSEVQRARKFWGWGYEGEGLPDAEVEEVGREMRARFGVEPQAISEPPALGSLSMPEPRLDPPRSLASVFSQAPRERAVHTLGKSYADRCGVSAATTGMPPTWLPTHAMSKRSRTSSPGAPITVS